jgi:hypothetical protein
MDILSRVYWVKVGLWLVAPRMIGPIGIQEAADLAEKQGCELPDPQLSDAIWQAADLKIKPLLRSFRFWTQAEMSSPEILESQKQKIEKAIGTRTYKLVAGEFKDVVRLPNGKLGLYGWHNERGKPIQPLFTGHSNSWKDYSQGARLVCKISE